MNHDTTGESDKNTRKHHKQESQKVNPFQAGNSKVCKKAKIRSRYNRVPHLTQDITQESDKNIRKHQVQESQENSPIPAGDHNTAINRQERLTNTKYEKQK